MISASGYEQIIQIPLSLFLSFFLSLSYTHMPLGLSHAISPLCLTLLTHLHTHSASSMESFSSPSQTELVIFYPITRDKVRLHPKDVWGCVVTILSPRLRGSKTTHRATFRPASIRQHCHQCDQIGRFNGLWTTFRSLWQQFIGTNLFAQISHILRQFLKRCQNH